MTITIILMVLLIVTALWAVLRGSLLRSAIALAAVSVILTLIMFHMGASLAAVFELSVCAGLITVIFISTLSLTKPMTHEETLQRTKGRVRRFWFLPVLVLLAGTGIALMNIPAITVAPAGPDADVRQVLWNARQLDLFGQALILLTGVFGVVVLFKDALKGKSSGPS